MACGLLEKCADVCGVFISDLRSPSLTVRLARLIGDIPDDAYPLAEWEETVSYLTREPRRFSSAGEAKRYFLDTVARGRGR